MRRVSHRDAVRSLIAPCDEIVIEVSHDPQPPGLQVVQAVCVRNTLVAAAATVYDIYDINIHHGLMHML